jgi:hypothetical protein
MGYYAPRYFGRRYWAPRYWSQAVALTVRVLRTVFASTGKGGLTSTGKGGQRSTGEGN